ncbi:MAG: polyphosphate kinase 1 [Planctomycetaceae bacterium]|nr:polyphosphate kinase 1 [Planctomycetaceae bacterium]
MQATSRYINRELSWLEFNQRVLDIALDDTEPLLERLKFLAITAANLDEFFMVRVGGLQLMSRRQLQRPDESGLTPDEQLLEIRKRVRQMIADQYRCYNQQLEPALREAGIRRIAPENLSQHQRRFMQERFEDEFFSVLSPIAVWPDEPFPMLPEPIPCLCVRLRAEQQSESPFRHCLLPLGKQLPRILTLPTESGYEFMLLEDVITTFMDRFFPGEQVVETIPFRLTRNADLAVNEEIPTAFLSEMEHLLQARKESHGVRLEIDARSTTTLQGVLTEAYGVDVADVYPIHGPMDLSDLMPLSGLKGFDALSVEPWDVFPSPEVDAGVGMFQQISQRDILLLHPYESFDPVVQLIEEASRDPDVLSIKQTLYRTSASSPIVAALLQAAHAGKYVTVVVELKARFDEARNIEWARQLEREGVNVIYGVRGLKTHAKVCVIVRQEPQGIRRYVHFGTGNYNEKTARLYSDVSLMTSDVDLGADAGAFFNAITGHSQPQPYHKIEAAPLTLKSRLLEMIEVEIDQAQRGERAFINAKVNSLVDAEVIEALYHASAAGVTVRLNVRGICCLRPEVPHLSENIRVISIIDRYLEHARIIHFHHGGDDRVFLSSADWMPRNLDRRIELLVPVEHEPCKSRLIRILEMYFRDNVKSKRLTSEGTYELVVNEEEPFRAQERFHREIRERVKERERQQLSEFEPLKSPV